MIICNNCNFKYQIGDGSYRNIYGTRCPQCGSLIDPEVTPDLINDYNVKLQKNISKCHNSIREKILRGVKKCQ